MKRLLVGVGNRLLGDDGIGPEVADRLAASDWLTIDAGSSPENVTGQVAREAPTLLVIVDAADMGLPPGEVRRLPSDEAPRMLVSTHGLPLTFLVERLREAASDVVLIGIQPLQVTFGEGLSSVVQEAVEALVAVLKTDGPEAVPMLEAPGGA